MARCRTAGARRCQLRVTSSGPIMSRLGQVSLTKPTYRRIVLRCCSVPQANPSPDYGYRISLLPHPVGHPSSSTRDSASRAVPSSIQSGATGIGKLENGRRPEATSEIARLRRALPEPDPENRAAISIKSARPPIITVIGGWRTIFRRCLAQHQHRPSRSAAASAAAGSSRLAEDDGAALRRHRPVLVPVSAHGSASERNCALASTIRLTMANRSKALRAKRSKASWMICQPHVGFYVAHCSRLLHPHPRLDFVVPQAGLRADNIADRTFHVDAGRRIAARNGVLRRQDSNLQPSCPYRRTGMSKAGALSN